MGGRAVAALVWRLGDVDGIDDLLGSSDITEGTAAAYSKQTFAKYTEKKAIKAKFTQTGTAATAGAADIYLFVVRIPG
jgi:hypothetical protein